MGTDYYHNQFLCTFVFCLLCKDNIKCILKIEREIERKIIKNMKEADMKKQNFTKEYK